MWYLSFLRLIEFLELSFRTYKNSNNVLSLFYFLMLIIFHGSSFPKPARVFQYFIQFLTAQNGMNSIQFNDIGGHLFSYEYLGG